MKSVESSSMTTKATAFTFDAKNKSVSSFTFNNVDCKDDNKLCEEILKFSGKNEMSFTSLSDVIDNSVGLEFDRKVKGILVIGKNEFKAELMFRMKSTNNKVSFTGKLYVNNGSILKYAFDKVEIFVKGKK